MLVVIVLLAAVFSGVGSSLLAVFNGTAPGGAALGGIMATGLLLGFAFLAVIVFMGVAISVKRLHDMNVSGNWYIGFILVSVLAGTADPSGSASIILALLASAVFIFVPGSRDDNQYGPSPSGSWFGSLPEDPARLTTTATGDLVGAQGLEGVSGYGKAEKAIAEAAARRQRERDQRIHATAQPLAKRALQGQPSAAATFGRPGFGRRGT